MTLNYSYNAPKDSSTTRIVAITGVDAAARTATAMTREQSTITVNCAIPVGGLIVTPAVGEQWYVQRLGVQWSLLQKLPGNAKELQVEASEGQVQVGSSGPLTLHGSEVQVESNLKLGNTLYRDNDGILESSVDEGATWTIIKGGGGGEGGAVASIAGQTGDVILQVGDIGDLESLLQAKADLVSGTVPGSQLPPPRVFQYDTTASFPASGVTNTIYLSQSTKEIFIWGGTGYVAVGGVEVANAILGNGSTLEDLVAFFADFLPGGGTLIDQILETLSGIFGRPLESIDGILSEVGDIIPRIVEAITGVVGGTLGNLGGFFEGFLGFDPVSGLNTMLQQLVDAILGSGSGLLGPLGDLQGFFSGITGGAGSLIEQLVQAIIGPLTGNLSLSGLTTFFTNFRSMFDGIDFLQNIGSFDITEAITTFIGTLAGPGLLATVSSMTSWLTEDGSANIIQTVFTNLRSFFGGGIDFLSGSFNPLTAITTFVNDVLSPLNILTTFSDITSWLTEDGSANIIQTVFTNLRSFFGGNINFLSGSFNPLTAVTTFVNDVLSPLNILTTFSNMTSWLTEDGATNAIQTLFTNLRSFFGNGINFLSGSFNPVTAITTFVTGVLSQATGALSEGLIPELVVGKITGLVEAITGEVGDSLDSIQNFFAGFTSSPIVTGANNLMTQIVNSITGSDGVLADLADFFGGFVGSGSLLNQIVNAMTGVGSFASGPLSTLSSLFAGITSAGGNIIDQVVDSLGDFASSLDIAAMVSKITGININNLNIDPLVDLASFFSGFNVFNGTNTLLSQILTQAGSNLAPLFAALLGIDEIDLPTDPIAALQTYFGGFVSGAGNLLTQIINQIVSAVTGNPLLKSLSDLTGFFTNLRTFFGGATGVNFLLPTGDFNLATMGGKFIDKVINTATGFTINQGKVFDLVNDLSNRLKLTDLTSLLGGTATTFSGALTEITTFFTNLRTFFSGTGGVNFLTGFNPVTAVNSFITGVLNQATSAQINAARIADFGIEKITGLISSLTGGTTAAELTNFFTNLRKFLGIGTGTGFTSFLVGTGSFSVQTAINNFITNILSQAGTGITMLERLVPDLSPTRITGLISSLTGGSTLTDLSNFFANFRTFFSGTGGVNFLTGFNPTTAVNSFITGVLNQATSAQINAARIADLGIEKITGLISSLTGGTTVTELSNFFTNLRKFLGIGTGTGLTSFLLSTGSFSVPTAINNFINNILSQAGVGVTMLERLIPDLSPARITGLISGLTGGTTAADITTFFGNLRNFFSGTGGVNFLSGYTFQGAVNAFITGVLNQATAGTQFLTDLVPALDVSKITGLVQSITGAVSTDLAAITKFFTGFSGFNATTGANSLVNQLVARITGTSGSLLDLGNFFSGLSGAAGSIVQQIVGTIVGGTGTFDLQRLGTFFGSFSSGATTLIGRIVDHITGLISGAVPLADFFSGFGVGAPAATSLVTKIAQSIGGTSATTLGNLTTFFTNLRTFLNVPTFLSGFTPTAALNGFLSALTGSGLSTTLVKLDNVTNKILDGLIPDLSISKISDLAVTLTGSASTNIATFFSNIRSFFNGVNFAPLGVFSATDAASAFINNVLIPRNLLATLGGIQSAITGAVGGSLDTFFSNIRKLFGITATSGTGSLLDSSFSALTAGSTFITEVLAKTTAKLNVLNIPDLSLAKITDWVTEIAKYADINTLVQQITGAAGSSLTNIGTFFSGFVSGSPGTLMNKIVNSITGANGPLTNLTTFFGTGVGSLAETIFKSIFTAITNVGTGGLSELTTFFNNLRGFLGIDFLAGGFSASAAVTAFVNTIKNKGVFAVLSDLTGWFTADGDANAIQIFFTNLRKLFGTNLLDPILSFNPATALNTLITKLNTLATGRLDLSRIPLLGISDIGSGVNSLVTALSGKTDIATLVQKITGISGAVNLDQIGNFFGGFATFTGANTFLKQLSDAITTTTGTLTGSLNDLRNWTTNIVKTSNGFINNAIINNLPLANVASLITKLDERPILNDLLLKITGIAGSGVSATDLTKLNTFFANIKKLLDPLGLGTNLNLASGFDPLTLGKNFIEEVLAKSTGKLSLVNNLPALVLANITDWGTEIAKYADITTLVQKITGKAGGTLNNLGSFFAGFDPFATTNTLVSQLTTALMGSTKTLTELGSFFSGFDAFTGTNSLVKQIANAVTGAGSVTSTTLVSLANFFTNIRGFLGNAIDFKVAPGSFVNGTALDTFLSALGARNFFTKVSDLTSWLGGSAQTFFTNLQNLFSSAGLLTPTGFNPLTAGAAFINNIFSQANITTLLTNLSAAKIPGLNGLLDAKATITTLVEKITNTTNGGDLAKLGSFFSGFAAFNGSTNTLVQQIVSQITGGGSLASLKTFFDNLKGNLTGLFGVDFIGSLLDSTTRGNAIQNFIEVILAPANAIVGKFAPLNEDGFLDLGFLGDLTVDAVTGIGDWVTTSFMEPIIGTLTNAADKLDLGALGVWAQSLLTGNKPIPAQNIIGQISSSLLGIIPVSHIAEVSPNLLSQGAFGSANTIEAADGWTWDDTIADHSSGVGAAKVSITSPATRQLFSRQTIPVTAGDRLDLSGWIKTSGFVGNTTCVVSVGTATSGSFRLAFDGLTTTSIAYNASASTVQSRLTALGSIGAGNAVVTGGAGGPYTIVITGKSGNQVIGVDELSGGSLTVTNSCPIVLSLIPFIGNAQQNKITINTIGSKTSWTPLVGPTYTVPAESGYTSVLVSLSVTDAATAGSVWWDDISLTKSGTLQQSLVERLTDAWDNLWNGIFGQNVIGKTVDDLLIAAGAISSAAGTADLNGKTALVRIGEIATGLLAAPAQFLGNIGSVIVDGVSSMGNFLSGLWEGFSGLVSGAAKTVSDVIGKAGALRNKANDAYINAGTASGAASLASSATTNLKNSIIAGYQVVPITTNNTDWNKPVGLSEIYVACFGGGARGANGTTGINSSGGTGGQPGLFISSQLNPSDIPSVVNCTIGGNSALSPSTTAFGSLISTLGVTAGYVSTPLGLVPTVGKATAGGKGGNTATLNANNGSSAASTDVGVAGGSGGAAGMSGGNGTNGGNGLNFGLSLTGGAGGGGGGSGWKLINDNRGGNGGTGGFPAGGGGGGGAVYGSSVVGQGGLGGTGLILIIYKTATTT